MYLLSLTGSSQSLLPSPGGSPPPDSSGQLSPCRRAFRGEPVMNRKLRWNVDLPQSTVLIVQGYRNHMISAHNQHWNDNGKVNYHSFRCWISAVVCVEQSHKPSLVWFENEKAVWQVRKIEIITSLLNGLVKRARTNKLCHNIDLSSVKVFPPVRTDGRVRRAVHQRWRRMFDTKDLNLFGVNTHDSGIQI